MRISRIVGEAEFATGITAEVGFAASVGGATDLTADGVAFAAA